MAQAKPTGGSSDATEDISAQLAALKSDIAGLSSAVAELSREKGHEMSDYARRKADAAKAKAQEGAEHLRHNAEMAYDRAGEFVQERPGTALGIAAALGFLIGHMSARK